MSPKSLRETRAAKEIPMSLSMALRKRFWNWRCSHCNGARYAHHIDDWACCRVNRLGRTYKLSTKFRPIAVSRGLPQRTHNRKPLKSSDLRKD